MSFAREIELMSGLSVLEGEPLARHTTLKVGGPADLFVEVEASQQLLTLVNFAWEKGLPVLVLGGGSNVLVSEKGVRGLVIQNRTKAFEMMEWPAEPTDQAEENLVTVESGASLSHLIRSMAAEGWGGLEWGVGIPGTVGGAIVGNAGAYGGSISQVVDKVSIYRPGVGMVEVSGDDLQFGYRSSRWKHVWRSPGGEAAEIILSADIRVSPTDKDTLQLRMAHLAEERRAKQPTEPSAGSVFKNPPHQVAGYLTEKAGLMGHRVGDAQVSAKHANYIVNLGGATSSHIRELVDVVQKKVFSQFGIQLDLEIELVGEW